MMILRGPRFDKAYGQMVLQYCGGNAGMAGGNCAGNLGAVTPQPFFEAAINPSYCATFTSCTAAVASKEAGNIPTGNVWSLWSDLDGGALPTSSSPGTARAFSFSRSMLNTPLQFDASGVPLP